MQYTHRPAGITDRKLIVFIIAAWVTILVNVFVRLKISPILDWVYERVTVAPESVSALEWFLIDAAFPFLHFQTEIMFLTLIFASAGAWVLYRRLKHASRSRIAPILLAIVVLVSSFTTLVVGVLPATKTLGFLASRTICKTTVYERATSPNGIYAASVVQIDCGAISRFHRKVLIWRRPFFFKPVSVLFLYKQPELHLNWNGRILTINGDHPLSEMENPPPEYVLWGGALIRYSGPDAK